MAAPVVEEVLTNAPLTGGFRLGLYTIEKKISAGGFGVVYKGLRHDGTAVAIKEYLPASVPCRAPLDKGRVRVRRPEDVRRFQDGLNAFFDEADTIAKIHHERVIQVWDVFRANQTAYLVMPLERGCSLHQLLHQGYLTEWDLQRLFLEASQGVAALHAHGLLHLDIKPGNLWVRPDGHIVVLDLGASWWWDDFGRRANLARTPGFAAPEQHSLGRDKGPPDVRTDVYGLGASLFACLEGQPPSPATERTEDDFSVLQARLGQYAPSLLSFIDKSLALDRSFRFQSAMAFHDALLVLPRLSKKWVRPWSLFSTCRQFKTSQLGFK